MGPMEALARPLAPPPVVAEMDPGIIWQILLGGLVIFGFLTATILWAMSALRTLKRNQARRNVFISSALNNLSQGVVIIDAKERVVFCNDRYLDLYGLTRSDIAGVKTANELIELRRSRGILNMSTQDFRDNSYGEQGHITDLANGRSILVKMRKLPNGGAVSTHDDCTEQRDLERQLATTKQFLESVIDNVPVCVAAKSIETGRYILANRAFEKFSRFSRDQIVGRHADEIFTPATAAAINAADRTAITSPLGDVREELTVDRGRETRTLASRRVIARNHDNEPTFLIALFDDITNHKSLSRELAITKKFLETVVDHIPVGLTVENVGDGRYMLANRSAEGILGRKREEVTGATAADLFQPREAGIIQGRDRAAIKNRGMMTE